jgi:hypothetical protein
VAGDSRCPDLETLRRLVQGLMTDAEAVPFEEHLKHCARCAESLASLRDRDTLVERLQQGQAVAHDLPQGEVVEQLLRDVHALAPPESPVAAASSVPTPCPDAALPSGEPSGQLPDNFGRFQVRCELGRGGFGIVYLASDPQLGRQVALKVPRPDVLLTPELRQRFVREGRATAALDHPNVVPVHEAGEIGTLCYLVSAYCPGQTLAAWLKERDRAGPRPVPSREAALVEVLAEAVAHAHSRGVLHRDLKPSNVLLEDTGEGKQLVPRVTDFGLAKLLAAEETGEGTHTGTVMGTPCYMAPEQAVGGGVGPATDVWALGVILYELLTGRAPFQGATTLETLERVRSQDPPSPRALNPRLDRRLEAICLKCLEKAPARRYASAQALADDLASWQVGGPITARPQSWLGRALRRPAVRNIAAALLAALGLVLATWAFLKVSSRPASPIAGPPPAVPEPTQPEAERPPEPAELIRRALADRKPVSLIGATGLPVASRWCAHAEAGTVSAGEDGTCFVSHPEGGLLELLPSVPCRRYRLSAEVRHDQVTPLGTSEVGLYFLHSEHATESGPTHCYCTVSFDDHPSVLQQPVKVQVHQQPPAWLEHQFLALGSGEMVGQFRRPFRFPRPSEKPWRRLAVEVAPDRLRILCGDVCIAEPTRDDLTGAYRFMMEQAAMIQPALVRKPLTPTFAPGGLGLYVQAATASFRSVVIEPLPAD